MEEWKKIQSICHFWLSLLETKKENLNYSFSSSFFLYYFCSIEQLQIYTDRKAFLFDDNVFDSQENCHILYFYMAYWAWFIIAFFMPFSGLGAIAIAAPTRAFRLPCVYRTRFARSIHIPTTSANQDSRHAQPRDDLTRHS